MALQTHFRRLPASVVPLVCTLCFIFPVYYKSPGDTRHSILFSLCVKVRMPESIIPLDIKECIDCLDKMLHKLNFKDFMKNELLRTCYWLECFQKIHPSFTLEEDFPKHCPLEDKYRCYLLQCSVYLHRCLLKQHSRMLMDKRMKYEATQERKY